MASEFPMPYHHEIPNFSLPSRIQISGVVREGSNRFEVDLRTKEGEFLLHFNPRFGEDCVVRSSTKNGQQWQAEERGGGMPFAPGKPFTLEFMVEESVIVCSVNGSQFCTFAARDDLSQVASLDVDGDVQLNSLGVVSLGGGGGGQAPPAVPAAESNKGPREAGEEVGGGGGGGAVHPPEPQPAHPTPQQPHQPHPVAPVSGPQGKLPVPYQGPLQELVTTNRMRIVATPHPGAQRFTVNWKSNEGETLFHFNARFDQNCVVRNATVNHQYPPNGEEREGGACPFHAGRQFALDFLIHGAVVRCFVDGIEFCHFQARGDLHQAAVLDIHGDLALEQVLIA